MKRRDINLLANVMVVGIIVLLFSAIFSFFSIIFVELYEAILSPIGLQALSIVSIFTIMYFTFWPVFEFFYYRSTSFNKIKDEIKTNTEKCNALNAHIEELKKSCLDIKSVDYGQSSYNDLSLYNYKRPELKNIRHDNNVYDCSASVCKNAQQQPFKYLCKYFDFKTTEEFLSKIENTFNDFSAAEQGKTLLLQEREQILLNIKDKIPYLIIKFRKEKLLNKLGFEPIDFSNNYFPKYSFRYISPAGNSSMSCDILLNIDNLELFIKYIASILEFKNSIMGQRCLMTAKLREKIKQRDNYTCKKCALSSYDEPNLLLEIDHIIPVSKGGTTTEENLQTLCWKCNRHKSNKIE